MHVRVLAQNVLFGDQLAVTGGRVRGQMGLDHAEGILDQRQGFGILGQSVIGDEPQHDEGGVIEVKLGVEDGPIPGKLFDPDAILAPATGLEIFKTQVGDPGRVFVPPRIAAIEKEKSWRP